MNTKLNLLIAALLIIAYAKSRQVSAQVPTAEEIPEYVVIDLGTLGGDSSFAYGINDNGQVVGGAETSNGSEHAFLYSNGVMQDLGTVGGDYSCARGINDNGKIVGDSQFSHDSYTHAFLYSNGLMQDLGGLGVSNSSACDINNDGQTVGYSIMGYGYFHAFLYSKGSLKDLGSLLGGEDNSACGINNNGQVVGSSWVGNTRRSHAFLYSNGSVQDLGKLRGGEESFAYQINNHGQVVGQSQFRPYSYACHAFLYANGKMRDLGTLGGENSFALGINDSEQVIGNSRLNREPPGYHPFLYSNGIMRDLNDLITPTSGWELKEAWAINNAGQIVGYGANPSGKTHAFLLNPLPAGWRKVIEAQPAQPTYGECPEKLTGKDSLVVVTHGWQPAWQPVDIGWVQEMTNRITRYIENQGRNNWQVHAHRWVEKARTSISDDLLLGAETALQNGKREGSNLGKCLAAKNWNHIHLIGFSAGAGLIQATSETIKKWSRNTTTVHTTFLDAFVGLTQTERDEYGKHADWADSYFSHDMDTFGDIAAWTEGPFQSVYNVDVTWLDLSKKPITVVYSTPSGDISQTCYQTVSSHKWPHEFYADTIPPNSVFGSDGFGFPLSKEAGGWDNLPARYPVGNNPPRVLGSGELVCPKLETKLTVSAVSRPDLTKEVIKSETGTVIIHGIDSFSLKTASPAWLAVPTVITNAVNFVSFEAQFASSNGAEGLLSVFWDTNAIGSIDERVTLTGSQAYTFQLPHTAANSVGLVGFRLDAFSTIPSLVTVTNVTLGFAGIREPFTLAVTDTLTSGALVLQLKGPAGFNYAVETSLNLADWNVIAVLVNTNGAVRFTVPLETNTAARFYRAVVP